MKTLNSLSPVNVGKNNMFPRSISVDQTETERSVQQRLSSTSSFSSVDSTDGNDDVSGKCYCFDIFKQYLLNDVQLNNWTCREGIKIEKVESDVFEPEQ